MSNSLDDLSISAIAEMCHEVNRAYCASQGDHSQVPWADAPAWQVASALAGVRGALADPDRKPGASHESWLAHKEKDGWVWGEIKDPEANPPTHPSMVPFEELSPAEKAKDFLFLAVVNTCRGKA